MDELNKKTIKLIKYYISSVNNYNDSKEFCNQLILSQKRLQRIIYLFEALYMKEHHGRPYLSENYYAWPRGPAIPQLYTKYADMTSLIKRVSDVDLPPEKIQKLMNYILELTNNIDTSNLEEKITRPGSPWYEVINGPHIITHYYNTMYVNIVEEEVPAHLLVIPKRKIYQYYKNKNIFD